MSDPVILIIKTCVSFLAAFLAIWVWTKIREEGWLLLVLGTLVQFTLFLLETLTLFGIIPLSAENGLGYPVWFVLLQASPYLLYAMGFGFFLYRNRHE